MKRLIDSGLIGKMIRWFIVILLIKAVMIGLLFFLPFKGIDVSASPEESMYQKYAIASAMKLTKKQEAAPVNAAPVYKISNWKLVGLFDDKTNGFAAVEDQGNVIVLSRGEEHKGYTLTEIYAIKAIFTKEGKRYELNFQEDATPVNAITAAEPSIVALDKAVFVKRNEIKHYAKNFDAIWQNIKIKEVIENKRLKGFDVTWVQKGSVFAKLGLQKGDRIIGANGKIFKSVSQVFKLYNNLDDIDSMKLKVLRDNQEKELEYEIYE